jgi:hypothetical protein
MTERLGIKRKLTANQKLKLAKLAWQKFIDPKLRDKELKARQGVIDAIMHAAERIADDIPTLRRHGMSHSFRHVSLPHSFVAVVGQKEFVVGDKTVTRPEKETIYRPREWDHFTPHNMTQAMHGSATSSHSSYHDGKFASNLELPKAIEVPALSKTFKDESVLGMQEQHTYGSEERWLEFYHSGFMTPKIAAATQAYYLAGRTRLVEEGKMAMAASRLISASTYYSQILEFWPEAVEIEGDLFEDRLPPAVSLVTISDEDKALLCRNMRSRGVKGSDLCKVAA